MARLRSGLVVGCLGLTLLAACKKADGPAPASKVAPAVLPATPAPAASVPMAFVLFGTVVKREPNEKAKVDENGKSVSNWLATLVRGEAVYLLGRTEGDYQQVRMSDDVEGWAKKQGLLPAKDVSVAAVLEDAEVFDRPDPLALNSKRTVKAGGIVFVTKTRDQFNEVSAVGLGTAWVLGAKLSQDVSEVEVAGMITRARELLAADAADAAEEALRLAKNIYPSAKLVASSSEFDSIVVDTPVEAPTEPPGADQGFEQDCSPPPGEAQAGGHEERVRQQCPDCEALRGCLKSGSWDDCSKQFPNNAAECLEWCKDDL